MERFTRREVLRILGLTEKQLSYWQRLRLVRPRKRWGQEFYTFQDLISLRTIKQLTGHRVPARRLRRAVEALTQQLGTVGAPLTELRILSNGREIVVEHEGACLEPISGQLLFNFDARELVEKAQVIPERTAEEWFALALEWEDNPVTRLRAVEAYEKVLEKRPGWTEPRINLGTLRYEQGNAAAAAECYRQAVELDPQNALARFDLGSVLDELGDPAGAREQLGLAVKILPHYADAHYNLALICEKLGLLGEARQHWQRYLELDPSSHWADIARQRLAPNRPHG